MVAEEIKKLIITCQCRNCGQIMSYECEFKIEDGFLSISCTVCGGLTFIIGLENE